MDPATLSLLASAIPAIGSFLGGLFTGGGGNKIPKEQAALLGAQTEATKLGTANTQLSLDRRRAQDPLFRALSLMAAQRLPVFAQQGFDFSGLYNPIGRTTAQAQSRPIAGREPTGRAIPRY